MKRKPPRPPKPPPPPAFAIKQSSFIAIDRLQSAPRPERQDRPKVDRDGYLIPRSRGGFGPQITPPQPDQAGVELREDFGVELREDGGIELREPGTDVALELREDDGLELREDGGSELRDIGSPI